MGFYGGIVSPARSAQMPPQNTRGGFQGMMMADTNAAAPGQASAMGGSNPFNVTTSITPQGVYSPVQTQQAKNQAMADAYQQSSLPWLLKQFDRPGMSRSAGTMSAALPQYAQGIANAGLAGQTIPFQDAATNAQQLLQGQTARENEAQGLARVLAGFQGSNLNFQTNQRNQIFDLLSNLL